MGGMQRARLSRDEVRSMLLEEGQLLLRDEGFGSGPGNLTFKRVFERLERRTGVRLTNASVIRRVWMNQADYQADVLVAIAQDSQMPQAEGAVLAMQSLLAGFDLSTTEARARAVRSLCRIVGGANTVGLSTSEARSLWINLLAMATEPSEEGPRRRILPAFRDGYRDVYDFWSATYEAMLGQLGLRCRAPWTLREFTMAVTALSEGCAMRNRIDEHIEVFVRPTGPDGEDEEWTLFSIGMLGLVEHFFEPEPGYEARPP